MARDFEMVSSLPTGTLQNLGTLPFEVLSLICGNFDDAQSILSLSQTCRRLKEHAKQEGIRIIVRKLYPGYQASGTWNDALRYLTALSRAWNRKAFIARSLRPLRPETIRIPEHNAVRPYRRQSAGYKPMIDCYKSEDSSHETLIWGAGAELIIRLKNEKKEAYAGYNDSEFSRTIFSTKGSIQWISYAPLEMWDGRDDITAVKLLRPNQVQDDKRVHLVLARASGYLQHITVSNTSVHVEPLGNQALSVDCADVTASGDPITAAALSDKRSIALHRLYAFDKENVVEPLFSYVDDAPIWTTRFLSNTLLAIGRGPTKQPLSLFNLTPTGLVEMAIPQMADSGPSPIYAIEPLQDSPHLFLTGHYCGQVKLNDQRTPAKRVATYEDPVDCSPIYSLLPMTGPRFVAGGARHCLLKFFDMRCPSWSSSERNHDVVTENGYNIFLPSIGSRKTKTSPTYALAATSPYAQSFYAGIEDGIIQMDLHSVADPRAQPRKGIPLLDRISPSQSQLDRETENLRLVEHRQGAPMLKKQHNLMHQDQYRKPFVTSEYDTRWGSLTTGTRYTRRY